MQTIQRLDGWVIIAELQGVTDIEEWQKELVMCRSCKHYDGGYCRNGRFGNGHGNYTPPIVREDFWCADGERRRGWMI